MVIIFICSVFWKVGFKLGTGGFGTGVGSDVGVETGAGGGSGVGVEIGAGGGSGTGVGTGAGGGSSAGSVIGVGDGVGAGAGGFTGTGAGEPGTQLTAKTIVSTKRITKPFILMPFVQKLLLVL